MSKPTIRIHNTETNEIIDREMNDAEFAEYEKNLARVEAETKLKKQESDKRAALLEKLGITEEEAKLLLS